MNSRYQVYWLIGAIAPGLTRLVFYLVAGRQPTALEIFILCLAIALPLVILEVATWSSARQGRRSTTEKSSYSDSSQDVASQHRYLVNLLYGDRAAADRILQGARERYPLRSTAWIYEKVIQDLVNDRKRS